MAVDPRIAEFTRELDRLYALTLRIEGKAGQELARLLLAMERDVVAALQAGTAGAWNMARARELFNEINRIAESGLLEQAQWLQGRLPDMIAPAARTYAATAAISGFSAETMLDSWRAWERSDGYMQMLNAGHQRWFNEIVMRNEELRQLLQNEITRGMSLGLDGKTMAKRLIEGADRLSVDMGDPEVWANRIVRTEMTRINNDIATGFAQESGFKLFYNLGVADDRQSEICAEASQQEPMTLEEWVASPWGVPDRHPNCRCELLAWSDEWGLDFEDVKPALEEVGA